MQISMFVQSALLLFQCLFADNDEGIQSSVRTATFTALALHLPTIVNLIKGTISYYHVASIVHYTLLSIIPFACAIKFRIPLTRLLRIAFVVNFLALLGEVLFLTLTRSRAETTEQFCFTEGGMSFVPSRFVDTTGPQGFGIYGSVLFQLCYSLLETVLWCILEVAGASKSIREISGVYQTNAKVTTAMVMIYIILMVALSHQRITKHFQAYASFNEEISWGFGQIFAAACVIIPLYELCQYAKLPATYSDTRPNYRVWMNRLRETVFIQF